MAPTGVQLNHILAVIDTPLKRSHAAVKAKIKPGDLAVVMGAGPIGIVTALAALAGGCSQVVITDVQQPKLDLAAALGPVRPVNIAKENLRGVIDRRSQTLTVKMQIRHSGTEQIPKFFAAKKLGWQFFLQVPRNVYDQNAIAPLEH